MEGKGGKVRTGSVEIECTMDSANAASWRVVGDGDGDGEEDGKEEVEGMEMGGLEIAWAGGDRDGDMEEGDAKEM